MKTPIKVLLGFALVAVLVVGGGSWLVRTYGGDIAQSAVTSATGDEGLGELASKVAEGEDLSDDEIQDALDVDDATYDKLKSAAEEAGIDLNDSAQLREIAAQHVGDASEAADIVSQLESGAISQEEAAQELKALVGE